MAVIGFIEVHERWRKNGKMAYWLYRKVPQVNGKEADFMKKVVLRQGNRNNFSILL